VEHWFSSPKFCSPSVAHFISGYQETTDYAKWSQMYSKGAIVFSCFRGFTAQLTAVYFMSFLFLLIRNYKVNEDYSSMRKIAEVIDTLEQGCLPNKPKYTL